MRQVWIALLAAGLTASTASAQIDIDFTSETTGPIHGRTIQGVTFEYFVGGSSSTDAVVGGGPGCMTFVCGPHLEGGSAGELLMTFLSPVSSLSFGLAMNTLVPATVFVELFDAGLSSIGIFDMMLANEGFGTVEGLFVHDGAAIGRASVSFENRDLRFALDNIRSPADRTVTPEPMTMLLVGSGLAGIAGAARRRRASLEG